MEGLLKDLTQAKPPAPEVDRERMERDLARIIAMPRPAKTRTSARRFGPVLVAAAVIALAVVLLPRPAPPVQPAAPAQQWHVLTQKWELMIVGEPANPYTVLLSATDERWASAQRQFDVIQKNGAVEPFTRDDEAKWETAGKPSTAPQLGGHGSVRIGPMQLGVRRIDAPESNPFAGLPADSAELKKTLQTVAGDNGSKDSLDYRTALLAMEMTTANIRDDQRRAAFEVLKTLDGVRQLGEAKLRDGRSGVGVAIPAPPSFQFTSFETQLVVNPETGLPMVRRNILTAPEHGLPVNTPIFEEEYLLLERTTIDPILPEGVTVNGAVESPIIER
ncbi:hypothetical protein [Lentzea aerocolonigenes]|uniref:hypothetical protein n=1 Tax=Lentzea aerocolonigenes TaxID=68170 RepID=UPI0007508694|nr:hypothetical protein [Lentzea aerocolonigenes]MCP2244865.1 hypothetical protein [Lentzea aerocolonigenes]MCP2245240.1 hypothetical protein [Lentzea aerocolonigenes]